MKKKMNSYGKTWHIWDTGHAGHPAANPLPLGEPLKAAYSPAQLRELLATYGFTVMRDQSIPELAQEVAPAATKLAAPIKHHRVAVADKA